MEPQIQYLLIVSVRITPLLTTKLIITISINLKKSGEP